MSTFRATVRTEGGTLHTARPLTAPEPIADMIDSLIYSVSEVGKIDDLSVELTVETPAQSDTWIGDSIAATSSTPLEPSGRRADDVEAPAVDDEDGDPSTVSIPLGVRP